MIHGGDKASLNLIDHLFPGEPQRWRREIPSVVGPLPRIREVVAVCSSSHRKRLGPSARTIGIRVPNGVTLLRHPAQEKRMRVFNKYRLPNEMQSYRESVRWARVMLWFAGTWQRLD